MVELVFTEGRIRFGIGLVHTRVICILLLIRVVFRRVMDRVCLKRVVIVTLVVTLCGARFRRVICEKGAVIKGGFNGGREERG